MSLCLMDSTLQSIDRKALPFPKKPQDWNEQILDKGQAVAVCKGRAAVCYRLCLCICKEIQRESESLAQ